VSNVNCKNLWIACWFSVFGFWFSAFGFSVSGATATHGPRIRIRRWFIYFVRVNYDQAVACTQPLQYYIYVSI